MPQNTHKLITSTREHDDLTIRLLVPPRRLPLLKAYSPQHVLTQSHHPLRHHRGGPHAINVTAPAHHTGADRRRTNRCCLSGRLIPHLHAYAAVMGAHVRVGLEDILFIERDKLEHRNAQQVHKIRRIFYELGFSVATPAEARRER